MNKKYAVSYENENRSNVFRCECETAEQALAKFMFGKFGQKIIIWNVSSWNEEKKEWVIELK